MISELETFHTEHSQTARLLNIITDHTPYNYYKPPMHLTHIHTLLGEVLPLGGGHHFPRLPPSVTFLTLFSSCVGQPLNLMLVFRVTTVPDDVIIGAYPSRRCGVSSIHHGWTKKWTNLMCLLSLSLCISHNYMHASSILNKLTIGYGGLNIHYSDGVVIAS